MINLDDRVIDELNECELFFCLHIAKRMRRDRMASWPSLETIAGDCRWDPRTAQKWRKSLMDKGWLNVEQRPGKTPIYSFKKGGIGVYFGLETVPAMPESEGGAKNEGGTKNEGGQNLYPHPPQKMPPELINKYDDDNGRKAEISTVEAKLETSGLPGAGWTPFDIDEAAKSLKSDQLARDRFGRDLRITLSEANLKFSGFVDAFVEDQKTVKTTYPNESRFRQHFFNWITTAPQKKAQVGQPTQGRQPSQAQAPAASPYANKI